MTNKVNEWIRFKTVLHLQVGSSLLNDLASSPDAIKDIDDFHSTVNDL